MTQLLADMLPAAMLGLCIAIPFGPICLMCVQRTLALGIWFGIASGMGAAVAHGLFSFLAEASAAVLAQTALTVQVPLRIAGGLALIFVGLRTCCGPTSPTRGTRCGDLCSAFMSTLLIAAANPMTMLPYLAIAAVPQAGNPLLMNRGFAAPIGVMLGSASWYVVLALGTNAMFRHLQKAALDRLNVLAGILLIGLGAALCGGSSDAFAHWGDVYQHERGTLIDLRQRGSDRVSLGQQRCTALIPIQRIDLGAKYRPPRCVIEAAAH